MLKMSTIKSWMGYPVDISGTISLSDMLDVIHQIRQIAQTDKVETVVPS